MGRVGRWTYLGVAVALWGALLGGCADARNSGGRTPGGLAANGADGGAGMRANAQAGAGIDPRNGRDGRGARGDAGPRDDARDDALTRALAGVDARPRSLEESAELVLAVPARSQAAEAPAAGWCGETAIQEGLLHLGVFLQQAAINKAGHPVHPDLYATEIPGTLTALGVKYTPYPGARGYEGFRAWAIKALQDGHPVLAGVKLVPSEHPSWGLDHFVLVVGHGKPGLLVNTTWGHRAWVAEDGASGLSFKGAFYGLRLDGLRAEARRTLAQAR